MYILSKDLLLNDNITEPCLSRTRSQTRVVPSSRENLVQQTPRNITADQRSRSSRNLVARSPSRANESSFASCRMRGDAADVASPEDALISRYLALISFGIDFFLIPLFSFLTLRLLLITFFPFLLFLLISITIILFLNFFFLFRVSFVLICSPYMLTNKEREVVVSYVAILHS